MPDSPHPTMTRRAWRAMSALGCVLGAAGLLFAAIGTRGLDDQSARTEKAVCAVLTYVSDQVQNVTNPAAQKTLEDLASDMRKTGVNCPPDR